MGPSFTPERVRLLKQAGLPKQFWIRNPKPCTLIKGCPNGNPERSKPQRSRRRRASVRAPMPTNIKA